MRPATFANGSASISIGPAWSASTIDGPSDGMIRKYLRSDASPVSGTTRAPRSTRSQSHTKRSIRSRSCSASLVRCSGIEWKDRKTVLAALHHNGVSIDRLSRHTDAVRNHASLDHRVAADHHIVPQNRVSNMRRWIDSRALACIEGSRRQRPRRAEVVLSCSDVFEIGVRAKSTDCARLVTDELVVHASDSPRWRSFRQMPEDGRLDDLDADEVSRALRFGPAPYEPEDSVLLVDA